MILLGNISAHGFTAEDIAEAVVSTEDNTERAVLVEMFSHTHDGHDPDFYLNTDDDESER
jgi:hypothetical protein